MDMKHRAKQACGIFLVLLGCAQAVRVFRNIDNLWKIDKLTIYSWRIGSLVLLASFSAYFICTGLRMVNPMLIKPFRFGWGKILFGSTMLFTQVASHYHLVPEEGPFSNLKPSNAGEAVGWEVAAMAMSVLALYLIYRGIRAGFYQRKSLPTQIISSPPQQ
jgi:hypothetical protein